MPRGPAAAAKNQLKTSNAIGAGYNANAGALYGSLEPQLQSWAKNPPGLAPADLAAERMDAAQSLGGSTGGITGEGALRAARTRNAAGFGAAENRAARTSGEELSQANEDIAAENARLKNEQQRFALSSLGNLYGTNVGAGESYYGMAPSEINAWTNASPGWVQSFGDIMRSLKASGKVGGFGIGG